MTHRFVEPHVLLDSLGRTEVPIPRLQLHKAPVVEQIGTIMTEAKMASVMPLPNARVPVVKFAVPQTATKVSHDPSTKL